MKLTPDKLMTGKVKISSIREKLFQQIAAVMMLILQSLSSLRGDICNERLSSYYLSRMQEKLHNRERKRKTGENYSLHTSSYLDHA